MFKKRNYGVKQVQETIPKLYCIFVNKTFHSFEYTAVYKDARKCVLVLGAWYFHSFKSVVALDASLSR